jgi:hypothetical protein
MPAIFTLENTLQAAVDRGSESDAVEFKASLDAGSAAEWLEIVKDLVALANSGGGVIIFGVADDGTLSGYDCSVLAKIDPATLTDKLYKYTAQQFHGFELAAFSRNAQSLFAIAVSGVPSPLVFSKPGTYDIGGGKQKTAFAAGTVYFRHGAKSEPGNSDDMRSFVERRVELIRKSWLDGIAKVVDAPAGSQVQIVLPGEMPAVKDFRLVDDSAAPMFYSVPIDSTHPYRQKEVAAEINKALKGTKSIKPYQIWCVRRAHSIDDNATFCYKQKFASARFSQALVDWILEQYAADTSFFETSKAKMDQLRYAVKQ